MSIYNKTPAKIQIKFEICKCFNKMLRPYYSKIILIIISQNKPSVTKYLHNVLIKVIVMN